MITPSYLITERLAFYGPTMDDGPVFERIQTNPDIMKFMGRGPRSAESAKMLLMGCVYHQSRFGFSLGTVQDIKHKITVGQCGLYHFNLDEEDPRIEIAFAFFPEYWGNGYATEAVKGLQTWACEKKRIQKLFAVVNPQNKASQHVLKKCGFAFKKNTSREQRKAQLWAWIQPNT
jgi:RimJ/RimL family protein N-acetyltransferase